MLAERNTDKIKVRLSRLRKFCQIKLFPSLVLKNAIICCLVFKTENEWILKL